MDEEWEEWLKDAVEAGGIPFLSPNANVPGTRPASDGTSAMHPRLLNAARLGQWQQIPDFLHSLVRQNVEAHNRRLQAAATSEPSPPASNITTAAPSPSSTSTPRSRTTPNQNETSTRRTIDRSLINRLDDHFAEQFSRRPVPPLPSASRVGLSSSRAARSSHTRSPSS